MNDEGSGRAAKGVAFGLAAYIIWGFFPLFFKALSHIPPAEVLAHRIIWSFVSLIALVTFTKNWKAVMEAAAARRTALILLCSTILITVNWFVFILAVDSGKVLEASLGYFITPLVSVLFGRMFLGERLRPVQAGSVALAATGVLVKAWTVGQFPTVSLILAASFGGYGLARKLTKVDAVAALTVETGLLAPLAAAYAIWLQTSGKASFSSGSLKSDVLLVSAGVITAIPLVFYGAAIQRLRLATVGILQYLVPTMQFMLAVFAFSEPFTAGHFLAFSLIWAGLFAYTADTYRSIRSGAAQ